MFVSLQRQIQGASQEEFVVTSQWNATLSRAARIAVQSSDVPG